MGSPSELVPADVSSFLAVPHVPICRLPPRNPPPSAWRCSPGFPGLAPGSLKGWLTPLLVGQAQILVLRCTRVVVLITDVS